MVEGNRHNSIIVAEPNYPCFEHGHLPADLEAYRYKLPWPLRSDESGIFISAFFGGQDFVKKDCIHDGVDFHVSAGTPVTCIEDGQVIYGIDDERGWTFGNLFIQGSITNIRYRYCHLALDSLPWDIKSLWGGDINKRPTVKAGQILGEVARWFSEIPPDISIPVEAENLYGRRRDHLHLTTEYSPYSFYSKEGLRATEFNPLLVLQKPSDYFKT